MKLIYEGEDDNVIRVREVTDEQWEAEGKPAHVEVLHLKEFASWMGLGTPGTEEEDADVSEEDGDA